MSDRKFRPILAVSVLAVAVVAGAVWWASAQPLAQDISPPPSLSAPQELPTEEAEQAEARRDMVEEVRSQGIDDPEVLEAMAAVPRHHFVPPEMLHYAYVNHPLPIGHGQTISQPYIVALMTELLELQGDEVVLEVGTGSGYQAAILSGMVKEVYTMEIIPELAGPAEDRLAGLGYANVHVRNADGYYGWEEHAPFDDIIVTAAPDHVPRPLIAQLKDGGRLVIPVGAVGAYQTLWQIVKQGDQLISNNMGAVVFVPLTGEH
jgi:protein-L-isoaspartate(D-aspartate) O-methyltransferase